VPRLTVDASDRRVVVLELGERLPPRLIALAWHRDRHQTRPARAFAEAAQALCERFDAAAAAA
jgi:DNA-binding transcriptional LysR family regulator